MTQTSRQQHAKVNSGTCLTGERYVFTLSVIRDPAELEATHVQHAALRRSYSNTDCGGSGVGSAADDAGGDGAFAERRQAGSAAHCCPRYGPFLWNCTFLWGTFLCVWGACLFVWGVCLSVLACACGAPACLCLPADDA